MPRENVSENSQEKREGRNRFSFSLTGLHKMPLILPGTGSNKRFFHVRHLYVSMHIKTKVESKETEILQTSVSVQM